MSDWNYFYGHRCSISDGGYPIGITFMGTGVVFLTAVNPAIGLGLIGVGIAFIAIGIKNKDKA
jgi:hypothetical protein